MKKFPISIIIDDPAPYIHVFREHKCDGPFLDNGEELKKEIPKEFLDEFCDLVEEFGICGKFSIIPMPACKGDIVNGIEGYSKEELSLWLDTARSRLQPNFDFCPEMLTHHKAVDLETNTFFDDNEQKWATTQTRETLAPYIGWAIGLMRDADVTPTGVTSPWYFCGNNEEEYAAAICDAFYSVLGAKKSWYFLRSDAMNRDVRPFVKFREEDRCVVSMIATVRDGLWDTIECDRIDNDYILEIADKYISADGKSGQIIDTLERNSYVIICTHWQALFSNGRCTGLAALREVVRRVRKHLSDKVEWKNFSYLMEDAIENDQNR